MNVKSIIKAGADFLAEHQERREQFLKDAGIILAHEAHERKNRRARIRANHDMAIADIIRTSGVVSSCCGSACIRNYDGEIICAECLEACDAVEVKRWK